MAIRLCVLQTAVPHALFRLPVCISPSAYSGRLLLVISVQIAFYSCTNPVFFMTKELLVDVRSLLKVGRIADGDFDAIALDDAFRSFLNHAVHGHSIGENV